MKTLVLIAGLLMVAAAPIRAQGTDVPKPETPPGEMSEGFDLLGQGARLLFRGLMAEMEPALTEMGKSLSDLEPLLRDLSGKIGVITDYEMPEVLPNGDIIIRRKPGAPDLPPPDPKPEIEI